MKKISSLGIFLILIISILMINSCSNSLDSYQTGNVIIDVPSTYSLDGVAYKDLQIGLFPIGSGTYSYDAIAIKKVISGEAKFEGILPGTYKAANLRSSYSIGTYKMVQVVGGRTTTYELFDKK